MYQIPYSFDDLLIDSTLELYPSGYNNEFFYGNLVFFIVDEDGKKDSCGSIKLYLLNRQWDSQELPELVDQISGDIHMMFSKFRDIELYDIYYNETFAFIDKLYVEKKYRNNGLGSYMLKVAHSFLRRLGCCTSLLISFPIAITEEMGKFEVKQNSNNLLRFYKNIGYKVLHITNYDEYDSKSYYMYYDLLE